MFVLVALGAVAQVSLADTYIVSPLREHFDPERRFREEIVDRGLYSDEVKRADSNGELHVIGLDICGNLKHFTPKQALEALLAGEGLPPSARSTEPSFPPLPPSPPDTLDRPEQTPITDGSVAKGLMSAALHTLCHGSWDVPSGRRAAARQFLVE